MQVGGITRNPRSSDDQAIGGGKRSWPVDASNWRKYYAIGIVCDGINCEFTNVPHQAKWDIPDNKSKKKNLLAST